MNAVLFTSYLILVPLPKATTDATNPFVNAKIGDWVEYRLIVGFKPGEAQIAELSQVKLRTVITAVTDKQVTLEVQMTGEGQKNEDSKQVIDLTKPYDPISFLDVGSKHKGKSEKKEQGREKLTVADKTHDCTWMTVKSGDPGLEDVKAWFSKDVPLTGLLRLEAKSAGFGIAIEMTGSGRK